MQVYTRLKSYLAKSSVRGALGLVAVAAISALVGSSIMPKSHAAAAGYWSWQLGNIHGGGTAQVIAADPANANYATVGGDSWGVYNTTTAGNDWLPAMKGLGINGQNDVTPGDFFFMGMAYSHKYPGRVYALTGKLGNTNAGGFGYVENDSYTVVTRSVNGSEGTGPCGDATIRPRCTGNRVLVDYDAASGTEYIYAAEGNGGGVVRSADGGATWAQVGMQGIGGITGMAFDPADSTVIYAGTRANGAYRLSDIRSAAPVTTPLSAAPVRVEEMATIGSNVYAAADTSGIYKLSGSGTVWTQLGAGFFTNPNTEWEAVGGSGDTIYVGGLNTDPGETMAKSTDGGATWIWLPGSQSNINITPWGTTDPWWLAQAVPRISFGCFSGNCTYETMSIAVDQFNPNIVYSAGRSGVWKSEDGGTSWRPAVNHLDGTMHTNLVVGSGGQVNVDDGDWTDEMTNDYFQTVAQGSAVDYGTAALTTTAGGHTYTVTLGVPRDITLDGQSIADDYFRASVIRPRDIGVSDDGTYIYIALFGGGVLVGHYTQPVTDPPPPAPAPPPPPPVDNPPAVSLGAVPNPASGTVALTATASDDDSTPSVTFSYKLHTASAWIQVGPVVGLPPYTVNWDTTGLTNGAAYDISALATDAAGQTAQSTTTVTVDNADHMAPLVTLTSPAGGTVVKQGQTVRLVASATDNVGVTKVKFYVDSTLIGTDTTGPSPYTYSWKVLGIARGTHTLTAQAYDAANNVGVSAGVTITKQ